MVRDTSKAAFEFMVSTGYLKRVKKEVYEALMEHGPCTGTELFYHMQKSRNPSHSNVTTRLGELRDDGVISELPKRVCKHTGREVIVWETNGRLPTKFEKEKKHKCPTCKGKGFLTNQQGRLF